MPTDVSSPSSQGAPKLACLTCRQRKVACDRRRPRCGLCSKNDFECEYKSRQNRPGLRAGYVSKLEHQLLAVDERLKKVEAELEAARQTSSQTGHPLRSHHNPLPIVEETSPSTLSDYVNAAQAYTPAGEDIHMSSGESQREIISAGFQQRGEQGFTPRSCLGRPFSQGPEEFFGHLVEEAAVIWFERYHPSFPILHKRSARGAVLRETSRYRFIFQAITSVVVLDDGNYGMATTSLQSLQALLILSNHYYTHGLLSQFWNTLAMCQRMALHLNLHLLATNPEPNSFTIHQMTRVLVEGSMVENEEAIRAYWMTAMLGSISTVGLSSRLPSLHVPKSASLPCSESTWDLHAPMIDRRLSSQVQYPSTFSLSVMLAMEELGAIHHFSTKSYNFNNMEEKLEWQTEAQKLDERLTNWREELVAAVFRLINSEKGCLPQGEMEPLITLTNCVLNTAIIVLMEKMAPFPKEIDSSNEPWPFATSRCVYACENMAAKVRRIAEDQLDSQSPHLILPVFAAARFYVVYSKALEADVPSNLRSLAYYLHSCGKKSLLAQHFEVIIRTAVGEHRSPLRQCVLPVEFYDLRYSPLEIVDLLQEAAERLDPPGRDIRLEVASGMS